MNRHALWAALILAAALTGACSGSVPTTPAPSPATGRPPTATGQVPNPTAVVVPPATASTGDDGTPLMGGPGTEASVAPSGGAAGSPGASGEASLPPTDPELEARLPKQLGGQSVQIQSGRGIDMLESVGASAAEFLTAVGGTPERLSVAIGWSALGAWDGTIGAIRVQGADQAKLVPAFIEAGRATTDKGLDVSEQTVAGMSVTRIVDRDTPETGPMYVFARGDTLYLVQSTDPQIVEEALVALWSAA